MVQDSLIRSKVLLVDNEYLEQTAAGRATRAVSESLKQSGVEVLTAVTDDDGKSLIISDPSIQCFLLDWELGEEAMAQDIIGLIRSRNVRVPIFVLIEREKAVTIPERVMSKINELLWVLEDTPSFISGRVLAAIQRYCDVVTPPFNKALMKFAEIHEYSWHTPGHTGGIAFLKSPVGRAFYEYFGENLLRSDLSVSVGELGSLLDHSGPIGQSEQYAARVFGADRSYTVTNGSSTSNRIIFMASVTDNDPVLIDRNCHKSLEQSLTLTGAIPSYLLPARNHLGIIGPIPPKHFTPQAVLRALEEHPLIVQDKTVPVHAVITNSSYDGLCYKVPRVIELLGASLDRIHFDESWYSYAPFNPLYCERFGLSRERPAEGSGDPPTIFTVTSTHKLLAALSQASFIHIRDGRKCIEHDRFNEAFMMHASTSPQYAIIASNEVSAAMMEGVGGLTLTTEAIAEAVSFRKTVRRYWKERHDSGDWFFNVWNTDVVKDESGKSIPFEEASDEWLIKNPKCWLLSPDETWHGFDGLEDDYCLLDPVKVSVITPGIRPPEKLGDAVTLEDLGIPAPLVTAYLCQNGVVPEKTSDFTILFLFSIGITKGKWGTLVSTLSHFKVHYDANAALSEVLPALVADHPERYQKKGLCDLANEMFKLIGELGMMNLQQQAFSSLPAHEMTPKAAYQALVRGQVELVPLDQMGKNQKGDPTRGRVVATGIVPYPPAIPMLMPGENCGGQDGPYLQYLQALQRWDDQFPGFEHDIHGITKSADGKYQAYCVKDTPSSTEV
ncbi:MAG: arginine decarboxylase [Chloroflexi bacterium]|nr:arginine decarboxylase [Chloroflexota bacterium]